MSCVLSHELNSQKNPARVSTSAISWPPWFHSIWPDGAIPFTFPGRAL